MKNVQAINTYKQLLKEWVDNIPQCDEYGNQRILQSQWSAFGPINIFLDKCTYGALEDISVDPIQSGASDEVDQLLRRVNYDLDHITTRHSTKSVRRFHEKILETVMIDRQDVSVMRSCCDLLSYRIESDLYNIQQTFTAIFDECEESGVKIITKTGNSLQVDENEYRDIVYFFYMYMPKSGHLVEVQIGPKWVFQTFRWNSWNREHPPQTPIDYNFKYDGGNPEITFDLFSRVIQTENGLMSLYDIKKAQYVASFNGKLV